MAPLAIGFLFGAAVVLNEVLYDPEGPDAGGEFVELLALEDTDLGGLTLRFVNGADPSRVTTVWRSPDDRVLAAGTYLVIGGEHVLPRDLTAELALQNGPDAVQLWRGELRLDAVAWGAGAPGGEGDPAADVSSRAIGRVPDGHDTDDNSRDWIALDAATPGRSNLPASVLTRLAARLHPAWSPSAGPVRLELELRADGWQTRQSAVVRFDGGEVHRVDAARGDTLVVATEPTLRPGPQWLRWTVEAEGVLAADSMAAHAGPGEVLLSELLPRPRAGEAEWIELRARDGRALDLDGYSLEDASGAMRELDGADRLDEGERLLVASRADPPGVPLDVRVLVPEGGLFTLNDTEEWVALRDGDGAVVDRIEWTSATLPERGASLERATVTSRSPSVWLPASRPSPGRPNPSERIALPSSGLEVDPRRFAPDSPEGPDRLQIVLADHGDEAWAEICDLEGGRVRQLTPGGGVPLTRWQWDGRDDGGRPAGRGAYVVRVTALDRHGRRRQWTALVALERP